ncbi:MAG: hypothetical protein AAGB01_01125 [Cyanobacteria bacterium P01_F01_bin.42]
MISRLFALVTVLIASTAIYSAYTQRAAFFLRQETQSRYWPRYGTRLSGRYRRGVWIVTPSRQSYGNQFRGGGPRTGK